MSRELQPVEIEHVLDHKFRSQERRGCAVCGAAKTAVVHHGYPPSLNALGDGNRFAYRAMKTAWETHLAALVERTDLPRPVARVTVEGLLTVPDRTRRDQGNFRVILEKALGDALVAGGWLEDDDWTRYSFGGLELRYAKGESGLRLILFPTPLEQEALVA